MTQRTKQCYSHSQNCLKISKNVDVIVQGHGLVKKKVSF